MFWLENLNLRGGFKKTIMDYIADRHSELIPLYDEIYNKKNPTTVGGKTIGNVKIPSRTIFIESFLDYFFDVFPKI